MKPTAPLGGKSLDLTWPWHGRREALQYAVGALVALAVLAAFPALADNLDEPRSTFGTLGLVEMPSARMEPDGMLSVSATYFQGTQRYALNFQALPWLETSLRYTGLRNFEPAGPTFFPVYWDRSFAVKARLFEEGKYFPELSVGINDLIGTGVYSSEYIVATKEVGAVEGTLGMGWGRLGDSGTFANPFGMLRGSFKTRSGLALAGGTDFNVFFHGEKVGLFGGLTWHTPVQGFSLSAEYSSDRYRLETDLHTFKPHSQINYGATYQINSSISLGLSWIYGRSIAGTIALQTDPTVPQYATKLAPAPAPPPHIRTLEEQQQAIEALLGRSPPRLAQIAAPNLDRDAFVDRLFATAPYSDVEIKAGTLFLTADRNTAQRPCSELVGLVQAYGAGVEHIVYQDGRQTQRCEVGPALVLAPAAPAPVSGAQDRAAVQAIRVDSAKQDIGIDAIRLTQSEAILYYHNGRYLAEDDAINRLMLVLMQDAPARIEKFRLFAGTQQEFDILRGPVERAINQNSSAELLGNAITVNRPPLANPVLAAAARTTYPHFSWALYPQFRQTFFDPTNPLALQVIGALTTTLELTRGLRINGQFESNLYQNIPNRPSNSLLPHVRSDMPRYIHEGANGIAELDMHYRFRLAPDVYAVARAGYLENMFAGVGGEILWWPDGRRWALGGDLYEVKQRNFDRLFGLQKYKVATGHVSLYYQSPWHDVNFTLRAGQYLAGDRGITFIASRRFSTGVEIGAYFTKTNVSATQFGEGSFDKGILIRIPLDWALPVETQGGFDLNLRPVQRDGGQTLSGDATLFEELYSTSAGEIDRHNDRLIQP